MADGQHGGTEGLRIEVLHAARDRRQRGLTTPDRGLPGLLLEWSDRGGWQIDGPGLARPLRAGPGAVLVVGPGCRHRLTATGPAERWTTCYAHIVLDPAGGLVADPGLLPLVVPAPEAGPLRRALRALAGTRDGDPRLAERIRRTALGWAVLDRLGQARPGVLGRDAHPELPLLGPVLRAIEADPGRAWTRDGLARLARCSPTTLHERFLRCLGQTPMACLQRLRLAQARRLLATTAVPVVEIGERCGFRSGSHFNRVFRGLEGVPPALWRRQARFDGR
ncbi:MAG: hypothetical protein RLZZ127_2538 [Planctomycetota bacterium]|jgi:AraC-like DNA-binding protein